MYEVIKNFADLKDGNHVYLAGDKFPRDGADADSERIAELSGYTNLIGEPLIREVATEAEKRSVSEEKAEVDKSSADTKSKPRKAKKEK
jgi:hypothetical protein